MLVPYRIRPGDRPGSEKQPWLILFFIDQTFPYWSLIDSGALCSVVPTAIAGTIGLEVDMNAPLQEGVAVGRTKFTYRQSKGRIWVQTEVGPFYLDRPAVVDGMNFIILGRADFFRSFVVTFDQRNQRMDLAALGQEIGFRPN